jgi:hypothetical protein
MKMALLVLVSLALVGPVKAQDPPLSTVVLFNAVCMTCHEGECSGRMALRTERDHDGLSGHVTGYAGKQDDATVAWLKSLMGLLKTECRLPPPPIALPADGVWNSQALSQLTLRDGKRMFIPLGRFEPGRQSVTLRLGEARRLRLQVVADSFDIVLDEEQTIGPDGNRVHWLVEDAGTYFLRVTSREPIGGLGVGP